MKIMIDISEEVKKHCDTQGMMIQTIDIVAMRKAIKSGTTIPNDATNGSMLCYLYPNLKYSIQNGRVTTTIGVAASFDEEWWNAPYKIISEG